MARPIHEIAEEINLYWRQQGKGVNYAAKPYLRAMFDLDSINDKYGEDSAKEIILYFLSNASSFRGDEAKRLKAELKAIAGVK